MGTRNLTAVRLDGEIVVAQYCQWDGYPTGQGDTIAKFLSGADLDIFKHRLQHCKFLTPEEIKARWDSFGADNQGFVGLDESDKFKRQFPELHRDTGAEVLYLIYNGQATELGNEFEFIKDTLYCEWAYIINLDNETVEVFSPIVGFDNENFVPGEYKPQEDLPEAIRVYTFKDFCAEGAMEKLEQEVREMEEL